MSPWNVLAQLHWGWKAAGGFIGGLAAALPIMVAWISHPISENTVMIEDNASAITANTAQIQAIRACQDTIKQDLRLVRCWVRSEIRNTDADECLVLDNGER